jgi:hypothetical protein
VGQSVRVGEDILNRCAKCGVVKHVIVAQVDRKIVKVECKECGSRHRDRPLEAKTATARAARKTRARKAAPPRPEPDLSRPVRPYRVTEVFEVGDRIEHLTLGPGIVERVVGATKVQVAFADGTKTLVHGRSA